MRPDENSAHKLDRVWPILLDQLNVCRRSDRTDRRRAHGVAHQLPLFATDVLHVGARSFGFLSAALGYLLAGWLSSVIGVSMGLLLCALLIPLVTGAGWVGREAAEQDLAKA